MNNYPNMFCSRKPAWQLLAVCSVQVLRHYWDCEEQLASLLWCWLSLLQSREVMRLSVPEALNSFSSCLSWVTSSSSHKSQNSVRTFNLCSDVNAVQFLLFCLYQRFSTKLFIVQIVFSQDMETLPFIKVIVISWGVPFYEHFLRSRRTYLWFSYLQCYMASNCLCVVFLSLLQLNLLFPDLSSFLWAESTT